MMALAAGLPTSFRDQKDLRPEGETSLEMRQVLVAPTRTKLKLTSELEPRSNNLSKRQSDGHNWPRSFIRLFEKLLCLARARTRIFPLLDAYRSMVC